LFVNRVARESISLSKDQVQQLVTNQKTEVVKKLPETGEGSAGNPVQSDAAIQACSPELNMEETSHNKQIAGTRSHTYVILTFCLS
jgi:hypothetical protein